MTLVSITVCARNAEIWVHQCLSSLFLQDYRPLEIIAVNDGSTDSTLDRMTLFKDTNKTSDISLTIINSDAKGLSAGRQICLEFSKVENSNLEFIYKKYSQAIPKIGKYIVGDEKPYNYLIQTIDNFLNQDELLDILKKYKFEDCQYLNITGGIVAIHSGWKI